MTVEEIAERAGVAVGSIYNTFGSKAGLHAAGRELSERLADSVAAQNDRMVDALRRGIADGVLRPVDPGQVATVLWAAWNGIVSLAWRPDRLRHDEAELRALLRSATDVIANGLLAR